MEEKISDVSSVLYYSNCDLIAVTEPRECRVAVRGAGPRQVAPALPEHRHFPVATLLGPGHLCVPPRLRPAPSLASVTTALWAAALAGNDILDMFAAHF